MPPIRYYIKELRRFYTLDKAETVLYNFREFICKCLSCRRIIGDKPENIIRYNEERDLADLHYMYVRHQEKKSINSSSFNEVLEDLKMIKETYGDSKILEIDHIKRWYNAFVSQSS